MLVVAYFGLTAGAISQEYSWTFQTSETAGEPGFVNKQKWAALVNEMSGGRIEIDIQPIGAIVPHTETLSAVGSGILQGHLTDPSYFAGQNPAFALMGNLVGGRMAVEGRLARLVYVSLYQMHLLTIHGWLRGLGMIVMGHVNHVIRPRLKLH